MKKALRLAALALVVVPLLLTASSCAPECVDFSDCAAQAKAAGKDFTCISNLCKAGSPFPTDAGQ